MDWSSGNFSDVYSGTFNTPPSSADEGIYLLDPAERPDDHRVPIRPYDGDRRGRYGRAARAPAERSIYRREGFSSAPSRYEHAVNEIDWDERPMHYNPNAGSDWAHLVPPNSLRPYGGGWAPNLAFPMMTQSEGMNRPWTINRPSNATPCKESFASGGGDGGDPAAKPLLLIVIIVLLAMILVSTGKLARSLEKTVRTAVEALRAVALARAPPA